jgi:hypothetical protein
MDRDVEAATSLPGYESSECLDEKVLAGEISFMNFSVSNPLTGETPDNAFLSNMEAEYASKGTSNHLLVLPSLACTEI